MLRVFEKHKYLDGNQREQVAAELGIEPNQVLWNVDHEIMMR